MFDNIGVYSHYIKNLLPKMSTFCWNSCAKSVTQTADMTFWSVRFDFSIVFTYFSINFVEYPAVKYIQIQSQFILNSCSRVFFFQKRSVMTLKLNRIIFLLLKKLIDDALKVWWRSSFRSFLYKFKVIFGLFEKEGCK